MYVQYAGSFIEIPPQSLDRKTQWRARSPGALSESVCQVEQDTTRPPMSRHTERRTMQGLNTRLAGVIDKVTTLNSPDCSSFNILKMRSILFE